MDLRDRLLLGPINNLNREKFRESFQKVIRSGSFTVHFFGRGGRRGVGRGVFKQSLTIKDFGRLGIFK